jgi:hypothetical protein
LAQELVAKKVGVKEEEEEKADGPAAGGGKDGRASGRGSLDHAGLRAGIGPELWAARRLTQRALSLAKATANDVVRVEEAILYVCQDGTRARVCLEGEVVRVKKKGMKEE